MSEQHASRMGMVNVVQKHNAGAYQLDHSFIGVIRLSENPNREELVVNSGFVDGISDTITERQHVERNLSHSRGDASSTRRSGDEMHNAIVIQDNHRCRRRQRSAVRPDEVNW
jgi:hypothetical protein